MSVPASTAINVIFIDDEDDIRNANLQSLSLAGFNPQAFASAETALQAITPDFDGVVISDIRMPGMDGLALFTHLTKMDYELPVILISGHSDIPTAVDAVQRGAYDFLSKPFSPDRLTETVARALRTRRLILENRRLKQETKASLLAGPLLGDSDMMENLRRTIDQIADINVSVLIEGETGTGKGLIASMLHEASARRARQMVTIDCGALPDALVSSELFGHVSGAFPGATTARAGRLERAHRSSLFLDSADAMAENVQKKFELILDRQEVTPLGANMPRPIDVRVITASQKSLNQQVEDGHFSPSLYYRLNGITLKIPPLRQRREDISILFAAFLSDACEKFQCPTPKLTARIWQRLNKHNWPGNGRELKHFAERVALGVSSRQSTATDLAPLDLKSKVADYERVLIEEALASTLGDTTKAHKLLNLPRKTLYDKMKRLGIEPREFKSNAQKEGKQQIN